MLKNIEETELPQELPERQKEDVWRVWIYWLKDGKWDPMPLPSLYATEAGWRRTWAPKKRNNRQSANLYNNYRRIVVEKLENGVWNQVLDVVESSEKSKWAVEDSE